MAIENPCGGTGRYPRRRRVTPRDLGSKFGGKTRGECPEHGCDARVLASGRLAKHERRDDYFELMVSRER